MQQLTGVDASFLYMESPTTFGHVSSLIIFDPKDSPGASFEATKEVFRERLHLLEPMRRRLVEVPFNLDHPYWIEDPDFDLDFHIRETALPPPGTDEQLADLVARIIARPLDRSRPLWELYVIHGLQGGLIAQLTKIHHAAIDGVGGAQLLGNILDLTPDSPVAEPGPLPEPEAVPSEQEMLGRGLRALAIHPYKQGRLAIRLVRQLQEARDGGGFDLSGALESVARQLPAPLQRAFGQGERRAEDVPVDVSAGGGFLAPPTPFNATIGPHRRFAYLTIPLDRAKAVKNAAGVTLNDVVMAICAGALRTYLDDKGVLPEEPLRAMIPVSVRSDDQANTYGNAVSSMFASLATNVADPVQRMKLINESTLQAKESLNALPANLLTDVADFAPPAITARVSRMIARTNFGSAGVPFNVVISNVPGPQFPLYARGAEMLHYYPVSTITDTQGMNITVQSYNGGLDFGIVADRDLVPDVWDLMHLFPVALAELEEAVGIKPAPAEKAPTKKAPAKKASAAKTKAPARKAARKPARKPAT